MCYQCDCVSCAFYVHDCSLVKQLTDDLQRKLAHYDQLLQENIDLQIQLASANQHYSILTIFFVFVSLIVYELVLPWIIDKLVTRYAGERWASVMAMCVAFSPLGVIRLLGMLLALAYDTVRSRNQRRHYTSLLPTPRSTLTVVPSGDSETWPLTQAMALRHSGSQTSFHSIKSDSLWNQWKDPLHYWLWLRFQRIRLCKRYRIYVDAKLLQSISALHFSSTFRCAGKVTSDLKFNLLTETSNACHVFNMLKFRIQDLNVIACHLNSQTYKIAIVGAVHLLTVVRAMTCH